MTILRRPHLSRYDGKWLCAVRVPPQNTGWRDICLGPIAGGDTLKEAYNTWQVASLVEMPVAGSA